MGLLVCPRNKTGDAGANSSDDVPLSSVLERAARESDLRSVLKPEHGRKPSKIIALVL